MSPCILLETNFHTLICVKFSFIYIIDFCRNSIVYEMIGKILVHKMASTMGKPSHFWRQNTTRRSRTQHDVEVRIEDTFNPQILLYRTKSQHTQSATYKN